MKLKIYDLVEIKADGPDDLNAIAKVYTIDHWRKRIGVTNSLNIYTELPYRKIVGKAKA